MSEMSFFSISFEFIVYDQKLPYDLYVNSSAKTSKEKFVKIFPKNEFFAQKDLERLKKYHQLYLSESDRGAYLKSLTYGDQITEEQKTEIIKDSAVYYLGKIFDKDKVFTTELLNETITGCRDTVESMVDLLDKYDIAQVRNLIGNLSFHDFYTYDHSINVSMYCISILQALKPEATRNELVTAGLGGLLHDLGKIKIPTQILNKPDKLTDEEFATIQKHPDYGLELLQEGQCTCQGVDMDVVARVVNEHHENFNGTGYPSKVQGEDIHVYARITAIADFFDAITTKRSYHEVLTVQEAVNVMSQSKGKKLDPKLFDSFLKCMQHFVQSDNVDKELPDDFDACRPHAELPFQLIAHMKKGMKNFGAIIIKDDQKNSKAKKAS